MKKKQYSETVCKSKQGFTTLESVLSHIKIINSQSVLDYYLCKVCKKYHTTTLPNKKKLGAKKQKTIYKREKINKIRKFKY